MRAIAISPAEHAGVQDLIDAMHQLRARIFRGRLDWDVVVRQGREVDEFDSFRPTYILAVTSAREVVGCARLLPATGPTMMSKLFPDLEADDLLRPHAAMVESSRFCVDTSLEAGRAGGSLHDITLTMFAAIIEWSIAQGYGEIVTGTDVRFERILKRAGWPMARIGEPRCLGNTMAVAGLLSANGSSFERVRPPHYRSLFQRLTQAA
ncbi:acyl homoserine lactone synthase [Aminobacter lissarensis]|uniref:Acyl-homoserine-lactone synthase n=1 Tax=Aminobacter carboxidus TaxID=376165 RepID=A0A8E1WLP9_9HYPH|nr:acyl-homoserine-lactone synthase TraI [Aminobacter lissarensis]MBB6469482.1 acyl homoserine lactone synthase [Aminobacter lissarensis]